MHRDIDEDWDRVVDACPTQALVMDSELYDEESLFEEIMKDAPFFKYGGGVTFSGGEAFMQPDFLIAMLKRCKEAGIHTAIETSMFVQTETLKKALPYLDQIYSDCKVMDAVDHQSMIGVDNDLILKNIAYVLHSEKKDAVIVRTPLIPHFTATKENVAAIARFLSEQYEGVHLELLNYNPLAPSKYSYLDQSFVFEENPRRFNQAEMEEFYTIARENGIQNLVIE